MVDLSQPYPTVQKAWGGNKSPEDIAKGDLYLYRKLPTKWDLEELWEDISIAKARTLLEDRVGEWRPRAKGTPPVIFSKIPELIDEFKKSGLDMETPRIQPHSRVGGYGGSKRSSSLGELW